LTFIATLPTHRRLSVPERYDLVKPLRAVPNPLSQVCTRNQRFWQCEWHGRGFKQGPVAFLSRRRLTGHKTPVYGFFIFKIFPPSHPTSPYVLHFTQISYQLTEKSVSRVLAQHVNRFVPYIQSRDSV